MHSNYANWVSGKNGPGKNSTSKNGTSRNGKGNNGTGNNRKGGKIGENSTFAILRCGVGGLEWEACVWGWGFEVGGWGLEKSNISLPLLLAFPLCHFYLKSALSSCLE